ncbi:glycine betaine ABC transporter substrate-binding protein [Candidatus Thiodiazotropha endoloripes]|uniref:glycine betaine ABC transporter substrate-binding protein n=1 Tax=Candidatus Thiodiazotropha endoloripes TaxID=1818881 RepID=UPI001111E7EA|nr:glycine betaine ABC transporter substrate-binding protein [Candidatus Thiodiazotropha endoloripes]
MARHDFSEPDKRLLAERVGFHCSNPCCGVATIGPSDDPSKKEYLGVAAHIHSASIDSGPRANPDLTEEERRSPDNGIHLCNKCSTLIDKNNGAGYSAELLHGWKSSADAAAKARVYQNKTYAIFKRVSFTNLEKKYSTALTCSGLASRNVVSCPVNEIIVNSLSGKLSLASRCILKGGSGCGKSLLTYQTAYEFHKSGWLIFDLTKEGLKDNSVFSAPREKSLVLIDDAQSIPPAILENILQASHDEFYVLANWNTSTSLDSEFLKDYPFVDIVGSTQVELLKTYCLKNMVSIEGLLKDIGLKVNAKDFYSRIEARIERASKEKTPWLFNYSLTEGWNIAANDLKLLHDDENLSLVIVTVAAYQFATLDYGVSKEVVLTELKSHRADPAWLQKAEKVLADYCKVKDGLVRNKHYEYSRKVLDIFSSNSSSVEANKYLGGVFKSILKSTDYENGHANILEYIMFRFEWCGYELNRSGFIEEISKELIGVCNVALKPARVSKLNSLIRLNKGVLKILQSNNDLLEGWLVDCNRDSAYSMANLVNTLNNEKYNCFSISEKFIDRMLNNIVNCDLEDKSRFSYFLNRVALFFGEDDRKYTADKLSDLKFNIDIEVYSGSRAAYHYASLVHHLSWISPEWSNEQVKNNIDGIAGLLNENIMEAYSDLKDLIDSYLGVIGAILGIKNDNKDVRKRGKELADKIRVDKVLEAFSTIETVDVQNYSNVLIFIALYNDKKLKEISDKFDYSRLDYIYKDDDEIDHYHKALISLLRNSKSKNYMSYLSKVIQKSDYIDDMFIILNYELSLERLKKGVKYKIDLHDCSECDKELSIVKHIMDEEDESLGKRILSENEPILSKAIFSASQNVDDKKGKFDLLIFIYSRCPDVLERVFSDKNKNSELLEKTKRLLKGKRQEKVIAKLYIFFLKQFSDCDYSELPSIERRFPSVGRFDINRYIN